MSQKLVSRNPDLSRLRADGYDVEIAKSNHLLVRDVPYVNRNKEVKRGVLVSTLHLAGDATLPPDTHVVFFVGDIPCTSDGAVIPGVNQSGCEPLAKELMPNHPISRRPTTGNYPDYYQKMTTYIDIISGPAKEIDPASTAKTNPVVVPDDGESVFNYLDTASTKAGIVVAGDKLTHGKLAIVGLGGTGSYVLDLVAKTPVEEIHVFDRDIYTNHNAFRSPGAPSLDDLRKKPKKVDYFRDLYSRVRKAIVAHDCFIDESTIGQLQGMAFVFLCIDKGRGKGLIVERLEEWGIPFIDVGMGIQLNDDNSLSGTFKVTTSTASNRDDVRSLIAFSDGEAANEYSRDIQIADLSAFSAALAVIKWKKLCGFYHDREKEHHSIYTIDGNQLLNEEKA